MGATVSLHSVWMRRQLATHSRVKRRNNRLSLSTPKQQCLIPVTMGAHAPLESGISHFTPPLIPLPVTWFMSTHTQYKATSTRTPCSLLPPRFMLSDRQPPVLMFTFRGIRHHSELGQRFATCPASTCRCPLVSDFRWVSLFPHEHSLSSGA